MYYRIFEHKMYEWADHKFAEDCLEADFITEAEYNEDPLKCIITDDDILAPNPDYDTVLIEKTRIARIEEIKSELNALDAETVRPLRAEIAGTATDEDIQKLKDIEERAKALRAEYQALEV